ncbi:MAG: hypothetical protein AB1546_13575 [bacterium]
MSQNSLDLNGITVLTEAASGNFVVTPVIAAAADAEKVWAIAADSMYGSKEQVKTFTISFAEFCGVSDRIEVVFNKSPDVLNSSQIVTNLGFVRPVNSDMIKHLNDGAVIPLMCEGWEFRSSDIDLKACREKGIPVMGTDEDAAGETFNYVGFLCAKMIFNLEIEIYKSRILIVGSDRFSSTVERWLTIMGADTCRFNNLREQNARIALDNADCIVIADYKEPECIIGNDGQITAEELAGAVPGVSVIVLCGNVGCDEIKSCGLRVYPETRCETARMGQTLSLLGPKPVVYLHAAGLKVGEVMFKAKRQGLKGKEFEEFVVKNSPAQKIPDHF